MKNINKTTTKLLAILTIAGAISLAGANYGFAAHAGASWDNATVNYNCLSSLASVPMESGSNSCTDLATSAVIWDDITNSNLDFVKVSSGEDLQFHGLSMGDGDLGLALVVPTSGPYTDGDIWITTNETFGDKAGADWWKW